MVKDTSRQAYEAIVASGFLGRTLLRIYRCLYLHPDKTPNECCDLIEQSLCKKINKPSYTPRFITLERAGLIKDRGKRVCASSGRECHFYRTTRVVPDRKVVDEKAEKERAYRLKRSGICHWFRDKAKALSAYEAARKAGEDAELSLFIYRTTLKTH